jgi:hypothetical protein
MARTVQGTISNGATGQPISGVLVEAWDSDIGNDDFMGNAITDGSGRYAIQYAGGHWDPAPHNVTTWRPDIFIRAWMSTPRGIWVKVGESRVFDDQKLRDDRTINLSVTPPPPTARTVWGVITYEDDGSPAVGVRVSAYDSDVNNPFTQTPDTLSPVDRPRGILPDVSAPEDDDFMGASTTDNQGNYVIAYDAGHWDPAPHGWTYWRPDIYIMVSGRAPNSQWEQSLGSSPVHSNVKHSDGVRIDLAVLRPIEVASTARAVAEIERRAHMMVLKGEKTPAEAQEMARREIWVWHAERKSKKASEKR